MSQEKLCPTCGSEYPANERFCPRDGTALRSQGPSTDLVGSIVGERYHVLKKLGEGGMGHVYLAEHVKMGRKSAVKVMNPGMVHDADAISRFNREAANASRINHPNVAGIYDFGETSDGLIYLAMEFIEGDSLTSLVQQNGALPPSRAAEITRQAAEGLQVAHDMGIVHRDLKPDNIMVAKNRDGTDLVKVVDFGIAKAAGAENQKVTKTGLVVGTPEYMSPEQLAGDKLDRRSDVYSLALVAFHMLTGHLPFVGESTQESMIMRLTDEPKTLAEMKPDVAWPADVQQVMRTALERKSGERYQTAKAFGDALSVAVERMPKASARPGTVVLGAGMAQMAAPPPTRVDRGAPGKRKTPILAGAGVLVTAVTVAAFIVMSKAGQGGKFDAPTANAAFVPTSVSVSPSAPTVTPSGGVTTQHASSLQTVPLSRDVSGVARDVSYQTVMDSLVDSVVDSASGGRVLVAAREWAPRVTLPSDRATLDLAKGKALLMSSGLKRACPIFKSIKKTDLPSKLKSELDDAVQSCP